jgi:lipopolysaccharide export system protein LptA
VTAVRRIRNRLHGAGSAVALAAATLCAALAGAAPAYAEKADREKPINFSGDAGDANLQARGGTLAGRVIITQGTLEIRADRIVFRQNADNSLSATAYGNPVALRQKRDGVDEYYEGYAQRLEYDGSKELVELFDNALLKRGQDEIRSNYVSYNTASELFKAEGRAGSVPRPRGARHARARHVPAEVRDARGREEQGSRERRRQGSRERRRQGSRERRRQGSRERRRQVLQRALRRPRPPNPRPC